MDREGEDGEGLEPETSQHNLPNKIRDMVGLHRGSGLRSGKAVAVGQ